MSIQTFLSLSFLIFFSLLRPDAGKAQCALLPLSLSERVENAALIVEARVGSKTAYRNPGDRMIFTANELLISKIYKGASLLQTATLSLSTVGGSIGDESVRVEPELELETGEIGIFMLVRKNGEWISESGVQGFIRIDKHTGIASDVFSTYPSFSIQLTLQELCKQPVTDVHAALTRIQTASKRAVPVITSITPKIISAGTGSVLTITGRHFRSQIDTGSVQFKNGDDGGKTYIKALKRDYISWSDTLIRLYVRSKAGSGKIRVVAGVNGAVISADTLKIAYSHLNVVLGDTISYETRQIGMNTDNGITWKMNRRFYDSAAARGAFIRSLERWRCGTYINWDTLGRVSHSAIAPDMVNMCAWDTGNAMPSGTLAQCFSYWKGCYAPGLKWYVSELDIRFRLKPTSATNWNYSRDNAAQNQFHFESVATHELGHGHQLGHVIDSLVVMHYAISNGQVKPGLSSSDINAGNYVMGKSNTMVCGMNAHSKLNQGNCAMVAPNAAFTVSKPRVCIRESVVFTDSSSGNISAYAWNFGTGAIPASAVGKGPHTVFYENGGSKNISLTITTLTGNTPGNKNLEVSAEDTLSKASFTYSYYANQTVGFVNRSEGSKMSFRWEFGDGDSSNEYSPVHTYATASGQVVRLKVSGSCGNDDSTLQLRNFTKLETMNMRHAVKLYPNPATHSVFIEDPDAAVLNYEIYDLSGRNILSGSCMRGTAISIQSLSAGSYLIKAGKGPEISLYSLLIKE